MKKLQILSIATITLLLLAGCGESSNKTLFGETTTDGVYSMSAGDVSQILEGDILEPNDETTRVQVDHILDDDTKYVTILKGSATLLRGQYALQ